MPTFAPNDRVSTTDDKDGGYVISESDGGDVTWKNMMGEVKVTDAGGLKKAEGMMAMFRAEAPDLIEIAENVASFAVIQGVTRNKILAMPTMEFLIENALYEILIKGYVKDYKFLQPLKEEYPLTDEQFKSYFPSGPQLSNAANKAWNMILIDTAYRLVRKRPQLNRERMMYVVKTFLAMETGNIVHNLWAKRERATYKPQ